MSNKRLGWIYIFRIFILISAIFGLHFIVFNLDGCDNDLQTTAVSLSDTLTIGNVDQHSNVLVSRKQCQLDATNDFGLHSGYWVQLPYSSNLEGNDYESAQCSTFCQKSNNYNLDRMYDDVLKYHTMYVHDDCYYYLYSAQEATQCLSNHNITFIGDSALDEFVCYFSLFLSNIYLNSSLINSFEMKHQFDYDYYDSSNNNKNKLLKMKCHHKKAESFYSDFKKNIHITWHSNEGPQFGQQRYGLQSHYNQEFVNKSFKSWIEMNDIIIWNSMLHDLVYRNYDCKSTQLYSNDLTYALHQLFDQIYTLNMSEKNKNKNKKKRFYWITGNQIWNNSESWRAQTLVKGWMCFLKQCLKTLENFENNHLNQTFNDITLIDNVNVRDKMRGTNKNYGEGVHVTRFVLPYVQTNVITEMNLQILLNVLCNNKS